MSLLDVATGQAPIRVAVEADDVFKSMKEYALPILGSVFLMVFLATLAAILVSKILMRQ